MTLSLGSSSQDLVIYQQGGTSDYGKPAMLRPLYSAASPHNNNGVVVSNVLSAILTSWGPNLLCGSLHGHIRTQPNNVSAFTIAVNVLRAQFVQYRRRIHALEAEIDDLRHDNMMYHSDVGALESELSNLRAEYYSEVSQRRQNDLSAKKDKENIKLLKAEIVVLKERNMQAEYYKNEIRSLKADIDDFKEERSQAELDKFEIKLLEAEIDALKEGHSRAELDKCEIKLLKEELDALKEEHSQAELDKCEIQVLKAEFDMLKKEHLQAEHFIKAIVDIKLYDSVLSDAAQSVLEGGDAEDALIESVKVASDRKGSAWSRIIPAVIGPRSPEHYLSAIDLALKARKELHERRKISGFWKLKAMMDPANTTVITPSSSQLSDICDEMTKSQNHPREPVPLDDSAAPTTQVEDTAEVVPVTIAASSTDASCFNTRMSMVLEPSLDISSSPVEVIYTESMETIKVSISLPPSQSASMTEENPDEYYPPSDHESIETIKPLSSTVDNDSVVEGDIGESFTLLEQDSTLLEQDSIEQESVTYEGDLSSTHSIPERPSIPPQSKATSTVTTPSQSSRSSPTNRKPVTPRQEKPRPHLISPFKSPAPTKFLGTSRVAEFLSSSRENSELFVKPIRTLGRPTSPIRSRLSTPKNNTSKRPALQNINLNIPPPSRTGNAKESGKTTTITKDPEVAEKQSLPKPSTKDLRKRRGVIMVERVDIDPSSSTSKQAAHVRTKSQPKIHDPPSFPVSTSTDVFSNPRYGNAMDGTAKTRPIAKSKDLVDAKAVPRNEPTASSFEASSTADLRPSNRDVQPTDAVSPTTFVVSRLLEQFSDSDLGSLEMTSEDEASDSDCDDIRRVQNDLDDLTINLSTLPHIQRALSEEASRNGTRKSVGDDDQGGVSYAKDDNDDDDDHFASTSALIGRLSASAAASASGLSAPRTSRPATPYSKSPSRTFDAKDSEGLSTSTSGSSYATTSSGSDSRPAKRSSKLPLLGLARRLRRGSVSPTPAKQTAAPSLLPVIARRKPSIPVVSPIESAKTLVPTTPRSTTKPLAGIWNMRNKTSLSTSKEAAPLTPARKTATSVSTPHPKQPLASPGPSYQRTPPVAEPKSSKVSMGQNFIRRLSNVPVPKSKPIATPVKTNPTYLTLPSPGSLTKPRSHTINTVSLLPPNLSTPSPEALKAASTKPRSHTFNTYSPTTRSPLSRLASDVSAEYKANQSHKALWPNQVSPSQKSLLPKPSSPSSSSSRPVAPAGKNSITTLPLRVYNKPSSAMHQTSHSSEEPEPAPPTAAFMRPAASPASSSTRRMTNSIAPLIPNWTPATANGGGMTPKQCRSMFRNSLSMVVR